MPWTDPNCNASFQGQGVLLMQVQEEKALTAQIQADLGQEKQCMQHLKRQLQVR